MYEKSLKYEKSTKLFSHPFSAEYWKLASLELRSTQMLVLAALLTALRIAVKSLSIPIGPNLNITFGFIINSVGSMIYGPVMAIITSAISDTVGALLFSNGGEYFFPWIFEEIAGGLIFALFFYRAKITTIRVLLGRFFVTLVCNIILNPCINYLYLVWLSGGVTDKVLNLLSMPRMIKNLVMFPLQSLAMVVLFNAILPVTNKMKLTFTDKTKISMKAKEIITLVVMTVISALAIILYYMFFVAKK